MDRIQAETESIDDVVMPMLDNDTGCALDRFITIFEERTHDRFGTYTMNKEEIDKEFENSKSVVSHKGMST